MINTPANPIDLSVDLDTDRAVEAVISSDGGKLEAIGGDGTHYLLDLPAGSVVMDTLIRMTPVKTVSELPLNETATAWAVQLEPEGLLLLANASLTIQFPIPPPVIQQIPFQYQGSGQAFNLALPVVNAVVDTGVDAKGIQLDVAHFSGYGIAEGNLVDLEPIRQRLGGSVEDRMSAEIARLLIIERQKMLLGSSDNGVVALDSELLKQLLDQYFNQVIPERIEAAKTDCAAGRLVLQEWLTLEHERQLLGTAGVDAGGSFPLPTGFAEIVAQQCMQKEYETCRDQHIIDRILPIARTLLKQQTLLGSEDLQLGPEIEQLIQNCLSFRLDFDSTLKTRDNNPGEIHIIDTFTVRAMIPVQWKPRSTYAINGDVMEGKGVLEVLQYATEIIPAGFCTVTSSESRNGEFIVPRLEFHYSPVMGMEGIPKMDGLVMDYTLYGVENKWSDICIKYGVEYPYSYSTEWVPTYPWSYQFVHKSEASPLSVNLPDLFRVPMWILGSGDLVATWNWEMSGLDPNSPRTYVESGTFKLYHKPK